jgi:hypothetical protein
MVGLAYLTLAQSPERKSGFLLSSRQEIRSEVVRRLQPNVRLVEKMLTEQHCGHPNTSAEHVLYCSAMERVREGVPCDERYDTSAPFHRRSDTDLSTR